MRIWNYRGVVISSGLELRVASCRTHPPFVLFDIFDFAFEKVERSRLPSFGELWRQIRYRRLD